MSKDILHFDSSRPRARRIVASTDLQTMFWRLADVKPGSAAAVMDFMCLKLREATGHDYSAQVDAVMDAVVGVR